MIKKIMGITALSMVSAVASADMVTFDLTRDNYGGPEISCAAWGEFIHAIGPRAPIEMKLAQ